MKKYSPRLKIGTIGSAASAPAEPEQSSATEATPGPVPKYSPPRPKMVKSSVPSQPPTQSDGKTADEIFGEVLVHLTC
jgi:hypothetical protein